MSDKQFSSTLDEFEPLFFSSSQDHGDNDIFSSSSLDDVEESEVFSSFSTSCEQQETGKDPATVERVRQEIVYEDIARIYDSLSLDEKKKRPKKKHHTLRNIFIILLCLAVLGAGVWVYCNYSATVIDIFYTVRDYILSLVASIKERIQ